MITLRHFKVGQSTTRIEVHVPADLLPAFAEVIRRGMAHEHGQPQALYEFNDTLDVIVNDLATCIGAHQPGTIIAPVKE